MLVLFIAVCGSDLITSRSQGFDLYGFERTVKNATGEVPGGIFLSHRPEDAQVSQVYRISTDPTNTELERLTHFNIGSGRIISTFKPIYGENWRGVYRPGGAIMAMDFNGNEHFQLWCVCKVDIPVVPWLTSSRIAGVTGKMPSVNTSCQRSMANWITPLVKVVSRD